MSRPSSETNLRLHTSSVQTSFQCPNPAHINHLMTHSGALIDYQSCSRNVMSFSVSIAYCELDCSHDSRLKTIKTLKRTHYHHRFTHAQLLCPLVEADNTANTGCWLGPLVLVSNKERKRERERAQLSTDSCGGSEREHESKSTLHTIMNTKWRTIMYIFGIIFVAAPPAMS